MLGGLAYRAATDDLDNAEKATSHERAAEIIDSAHTKRLVGAVLAGAGVVLVGTGVLRFKLRGGSTAARGVGIAPARDGGLLTWTRSF